MTYKKLYLNLSMKLTNLIKIFGWSCLAVGLALFLFQNKPEENISKNIDIYKEDKLCAKSMLWHEARGTSAKEKEAVLDVALNRLRSAKYPSTVCKVINQPKQFSYLNNKDKSQIILPRFQEISGISDQAAYLEIANIVEDRFKDNKIQPNVVLPESALYYHTKSIKKPYWAINKKTQEVKIQVDRKFKHRYYSVIN